MWRVEGRERVELEVVCIALHCNHIAACNAVRFVLEITTATALCNWCQLSWRAEDADFRCSGPCHIQKPGVRCWQGREPKMKGTEPGRLLFQLSASASAGVLATNAALHLPVVS